MKRCIHLVGCAALLLSSPSATGAMAVVDFSLIKTNLANARRDLVEQILQGQRQIMQYEQLVAQVRQIDGYLQRFGDPGSVDLAALNDALRFLERLDPGKTSKEIFGDIGDGELFNIPAPSGYRPVSPEIEVNGRSLGQRNPGSYTPEVASRRALAHLGEVRDSVLERRAELRASLDAALAELQSASTASEVAKLDIVIRSLESQLAATGTDLQLASSAAELRRLQNETEERIAAKAAVEEKRALLKANTARELEAFPLPNQPILFKR